MAMVGPRMGPAPAMVAKWWARTKEGLVGAKAGASAGRGVVGEDDVALGGDIVAAIELADGGRRAVGVLAQIPSDVARIEAAGDGEQRRGGGQGDEEGHVTLLGRATG